MDVVGRRALGLLVALFAFAACVGVPPGAPSPTDAPYLVVLGTAQDGGLPQLGCTSSCCAAARADPSRRRLTTALLLADPESGQRWLFDAGPDLPELLERARPHPPGRITPTGRPAPFDGIFLTHAHMGHYTGLAHLGHEAYGAEGQVVYASARMAAFLRDNGPWSQAVAMRQLVLHEVTPAEPLVLATHDDGAPRLSVVARKVPHRDEYSDTLAFTVQRHDDAGGVTWRALYVPDIDKWSRLEEPLAAWLERVDVAFVDGSFFGPDELPGRSMADIPHPFISETLELLGDRPELLGKVVFTHLNHSNPAADPASDAARVVRDAGARLAAEGALFATDQSP